MKAKIALALTVVLTAIAAPVHSAYALDSDDVRKGVVPIVLSLNNGKAVVVDTRNNNQIVDTLATGITTFGSGSGFFVGKKNSDAEYIVTNQHVIDAYTQSGEGKQFAYAYEYTDYEKYGERYINYIIADSTELHIQYSEKDYDVAYVEATGDVDKVDLAVLKIKEPAKDHHSLPVAIPDESMVGTTDVYTVGFPGNAENAYSGANKWSWDDSTVHSGKINRLVTASGTGVERVAIDATIQHGNSGGPLVDDNGAVLGVNTNAWHNTEKAEIDYYAISSTELVKFLDNNNIPYRTSGSAGGSDGGAIIIVIIAAIVIALIAGGVVFFVVNSKKKKKKATSATQQAPAFQNVNQGVATQQTPAQGYVAPTQPVVGGGQANQYAAQTQVAQPAQPVQAAPQPSQPAAQQTTVPAQHATVPATQAPQVAQPTQQAGTSSTQFCSQCGTQRVSSAQFCSGCGTKFA